ncbi:MAG TPA: DNA-formamidopyrimidine glycosylase family protein, partial [Acidimicrobiales bacterium]|nr:DNA-formamidopyrimidine glycosylase family protein [Acidimicrobiales bacterium]
RPVAAVAVPDPHVLRGQVRPAALRRALVGRSLVAARRRGKLLLLDVDGAVDGAVDGESTSDRETGSQPGGPTLGMRFGMTGDLVLDDQQAIGELLYAPVGFGRQWVRFGLRFADGGSLLLHDPRRFGRVELDPAEEQLGPDAATVTPAELRAALATRRSLSGQAGGGPPLKARLLDQSHLAGLGNLLVDEILWRAGLSPQRPSGSLSDAELRRLHRHIRTTVDQLLERGGSHTGDLMAERRPDGHCPKDGTALTRATVGGRTTYWCPAHQR